MKIALVGIGKIAVDHHVPAIANSDDWELAATVSRNGTVDGVPSYTNFDEMLQDRADIQTISLCLPPVPRFDYAVKAINAGRHVMLEKPPGAILSECHTLEQMARDKNVALYATWHSRQAAHVPTAKAWLKDKELQKITITWKENVRQWHPGQDWIFEAGGFGVFDSGINALAILTEILPDPVRLTESTLQFPENRQMPIAASCRFSHPHGAEVLMELDWLEAGLPVWNIEVAAADETLLLENGGGKLSINGKEQGGTHAGLAGEYPGLYQRMATLVSKGDIDLDLSPQRHVADAFTLADRKTVAAFNW